MSIVVATRNDAATAAGGIASAAQALARTSLDYEIVAVDDRSAGEKSAPSARLGVGSLVGLGIAAVAVVSAVGWLYLLRSGGLLAAGPRLGGALPLQQLAGDAAQPVLRMGAAWLPAGAIAGWALASLGRLRHPLPAAVVTSGILLVVSGAGSDAVASSLSPGGRLLPQLALPGLWAATFLFTVGAAIGARFRSTE